MQKAALARLPEVPGGPPRKTAEQIVGEVAGRVGATPEALRERFQAEDVDLDYMMDEVMLGRGVEEVLEGHRRSGAWGLIENEEERTVARDRLKREHAGLRAEMEKPPEERSPISVIRSPKTMGLLGEEMPEEARGGARAAWQISAHDPESIDQIIDFYKPEKGKVATPSPMVGYSMVQRRGAKITADRIASKQRRGDTTPLTQADLVDIHREAARDMFAAKLLGKHSNPIYLVDTLDPEEMSWADIFKKGVEVVGLAPTETGQVGLIVREVSTTRWAFENIDVGQAMTVGVVEAAVEGRLTSWSDVMPAAKLGGALHRDFLMAAMDRPEAQVTVRKPTAEEIKAAVARGEVPPAAIREGAWKPWAVMGAALPAAIFFPDATLGFAKAASLSARVAKVARVSGVARDAVAALTPGAEAGLEAGRLDELIDAAIDAGKFEEAAALQRDALRSHALANASDARVRGLGKTVAGEMKEAIEEAAPGSILDQADGAVAMRMAREVPDLMDAELAKRLPGDLGDEMVSAHPSLSRLSIRLRSKEGGLAIPQSVERAYDAGRKLVDLRKLRMAIDADPDAARAAMLAKKIEGRMRNIEEAIGAADDPARTAWVEKMRSPERMREALTDPDAWFTSWQAELRALIPGDADEAKAARSAVYRQINPTSEGSAMRKLLVSAKADDPTSDVRRAIEAVKAAAESRTAARITLRSIYGRQGGAIAGGLFMPKMEVSGRAGRAVRSIEAEEAAREAGKAAKVKGPKAKAAKKAAKAARVTLSKPAARFAREAEATFKIPREEAESWALVMDARAETAVASGADDSVEAWWAAQGLELRRAAPGEAVDPAALLARAIEDADAAKAGAAPTDVDAIVAWQEKVNEVNRAFMDEHLPVNRELSKLEEAARASGRDPQADSEIVKWRQAQEAVNKKWMPKIEAVLAEKPKSVKGQAPGEALFQRTVETWAPKQKKAAEAVEASLKRGELAHRPDGSVTAKEFPEFIDVAQVAARPAVTRGRKGQMLPPARPVAEPLPLPRKDPLAVVDAVNAQPWFHGVTRTDATGESLMDYSLKYNGHGTTGRNIYGPGLYLAADPEVAIAKYAQYGVPGFPGTRAGSPAVKAVDVKARKLVDLRGTLEDLIGPLDADEVGGLLAGTDLGSEIKYEWVPRIEDAGLNPEEFKAHEIWSKMVKEAGNSFIEYTRSLVEHGFDGVLAHGRQDGDVLVLFDPNANSLTGAVQSLVREGRVFPERELYAAAEGEAKASILFTEGRTLVTAFRTADFGSLVHETFHLFRRDLARAAAKLGADSEAATDLETLAKWAGAEAGWTVEAEEKVARAGERYLRDGIAPTPGLQGLFARFSEWMTRIYTKLAGSPIADEIPAEIRGVFDRLLATPAGRAPGVPGAPRGPPVVPPPLSPRAAISAADIGAEPLPRLSRLLREETLGMAEPGASASDYLAREALRLGATVEGLEDVTDPKKLATAIADKVARGEEVIFDRPILQDYEGLTTDIARQEAATGEKMTAEEIAEATRRWLPAEIMDLEDAVAAARLIDASQVSQLPLVGLAEAVTPEAKASARLEAALHGPQQWKRAARLSLYLVLGGNAEEAMMTLPPWMRSGVKAATRPVILSIGEAVRIVDSEGDIGKLLDYVGGEAVAFEDGSKAKARVDSVAVVANQARWIWDALDKETKADLVRAVSAVDIATTPSPQKATKALRQFLYGVTEEANPDGMKLLRDALGIPKLRPDADVNFPQGAKFARTLLALADVREAKVAAGIGGELPLQGRAAAEFFWDNLHRQFGPDNAIRAMVATVALGNASRAVKTWSGLGMTVTDEAQAAYKSWIMGEAIADEMKPRVIEMAETFGLHPQWVAVNPWEEKGAFVPTKAKELLWGAVNASIEDRIGKLKGIDNRGAGDAIRGALRFVKARQVRGGAVVRSRHFTMNLFDHLPQVAAVAGIRVALTSVIRQAPQNLMTVGGGGLSRAIWLLEKTPFVRYVDSEKVRRGLQNLGDAFANAARGTFKVGKYHPSVNAILEGSTDAVRLGDHVTTGERIKDIFTQEGIFSNYHTAELARTMRSILRVDGPKIVKAGLFGGDMSAARRLFSELYDSVGDLAEAWAERERAGAALTLIESGVDPRTAARLIVHGLFDYGGSMSSFDRSLLVGVVMPYWAFQKNADRLILDTLFSPKAAYRMGVIRRAGDKLPEALGNIMYDNIVEPYGIDVDGLLPDQQDKYWAFRSVIEGGYGEWSEWSDDDHRRFETQFGKWESLPEDMKQRVQFGYGSPAEVPDSVRRALIMSLSGLQQMGEDGRYYLLSSSVESQLNLERAAVPRSRGRALRKSYLRDTPALSLTIPALMAAREYKNMKGSDKTYYELALPEPVMVSAFRQAGAVLGAQLTALTLPVTAFTDEGDAYTSPFDALAEGVDPSKAMLVSDVMTAFGEGRSYNRPIHPAIEKILWHLVGLELPTSKQTITDPELAGRVYQEGTAVLPAVWALPFDNSPLGEANKLMLDWRRTPFETEAATAAPGTVRAAQLARILLGLRTTETSAGSLGRSEIPRFPLETTTPPVKR